MNLRIDHIGYITGDIDETAKKFEQYGYCASSVVNDDTQQTRICFLSKEAETRIELVEPYEDNKTMQKMLSKKGVGPYHVCYEVDDIDAAYESMVKDDWIPLFRPVVAPAFDNRKICYFWNRSLGFIELVDKTI